MSIVKWLSILSLLISLIWFINKPDYEPAIGFVGAVVVLFESQRRERRALESQKQSVVNGGTAIQAGGDLHIGSISSPNVERDNAK